MGNQSSIQRLNFEDIQDTIKNKNKYVIINTLPISEQMCLIPNTIDISSEESTINNLVSQNNSREIIIYGRNSNDMTIYDKYEQLTKLGFRNIYVYPGGIFEWLCLQDIYGDDEFLTTGRVELLDYKPKKQIISTLLLTN